MIPDFDLSGVLPPYLGADATRIANVSPYTSDILELVRHFATSPQRIEILNGFLNYRQALASEALVDGFQWLDGSFVENVESASGRPPGDIDVVTFFRRPPAHKAEADWALRVPTVFQNLFHPPLTKERYRCDAYPVDLDAPAEAIVINTRYWFGLFSHRRATQQWKGIVQIPLAVGALDDEARAILAQAPQP